MRIYFVIPVFILFLVGKVYAQNPVWSWAKSIGGVGNDGGNVITADINGNVYTLGNFNDTVDFDPGPGTFNLIAQPAIYFGSIFLTKMDSSGNFLWARHWNKGIFENGFSVNTDQFGNVFVTGYYTGSFDADPGTGIYMMPNGNQTHFVIKLNSQGIFEWIKAFSSGSNPPNCFTLLDEDGNIYTAGTFSGSPDFDPGPASYFLNLPTSRDIYVLKIDSAGNFLWVKQISGTLNNWVDNIALDHDKNIYLTGRFSGTTDFNPGPGVDSLTAGTTIVNEDIYLLKLDSVGNYAWSRKWGGVSTDHSYGLVVDNNSNLFVTGYTPAAWNGIDLDPGPDTLLSYQSCYISKFDSSGILLYAKTIGNLVAATFARSIETDLIGNVYVAGSYVGQLDFDPGPGVYNLSPDSSGSAIFILKLNNAGLFIWAQSKGGKAQIGALQNTCTGLFADVTGNIYFTGRFEDPMIRFGNDTLFSHTPDTLEFTDVFIAKLASPTTGLNDEASITNQIQLYPNPSSGIFYLAENQDLQQISIFNLTGELVYDEKLDSFGSTRMDLSFLNSAVYLYKIMMKNGSFSTGKICIQK